MCVGSSRQNRQEECAFHFNDVDDDDEDYDNNDDDNETPGEANKIVLFFHLRHDTISSHGWYKVMMVVELLLVYLAPYRTLSSLLLLLYSIQSA